MTDSGSEMQDLQVECSTCVKLLERRSTCRHWSERKKLDTFRHDLIFCCTTAERNKMISWSNRHHVMLHTIKQHCASVGDEYARWYPVHKVRIRSTTTTWFMDVSPPGCFAPKTFRPLDVSPTYWTFRPRLWSFRPRQ